MKQLYILTSLLLLAVSGRAQTLEAVYTHSSQLTEVYFLDDNFGYAIGGYGFMIQTRDGGKNWTTMPQLSSRTLIDMEFVSGGRAYICGDLSAFYRSDDSGKTWQSISTASLNWQEMHFINRDTGYMIGWRTSDYAAFIYRTLDGGINWSPLGSLGTTNTQWDVYFHNFNRGFIASLGGTKLYSTADGGWNWNVKNVGTGTGLMGFSFPTPSIGYMCGNNGYLYKTLDSGITWTKTGLNAKTGFWNVDFYNTNVGWTAGFGDSVYITMNGGKTWNARQVQSGAYLIFVCQLMSPVHGWLIWQAKSGVSTIYRYGTQQLPADKANRIRGRVFADKNANCIMDDGELPISDMVIKTSDDRFFSYTNDSGNYVLYVDSGYHELTQAIPSHRGIMITPECPAPMNSVAFNGYDLDSAGVDFADDISLVPFLTIDVSSNRRRRCARNLTVVPFANEGFQTAYNVKITVEMPEFMHVLEANYPYTVDKGKHTFSFDSLAPGERGQIQIIDSVACLANLAGKSVCTKVGISPANLGARAKDKVQHFAVPENIQIHARCEGAAKARIVVRNTDASETMKSNGKLEVYIDDELAFQDSFKLAPGDSVEYLIPYTGNSLRIHAEPDPNNPGAFGKARKVEFLENCANGTDIKSRNKLPVNDDQLHYETQCMDVRDSYDPNDKNVVPEGLTSARFVKPGSTLEYLIRFQNTGSDTAYEVVVEDTLSEHLDPATFQAGASSFPYKLEIKKADGKHLLRFMFNGINLPDSMSNPLRSQGFIKYKIAPKSTVVKGTVIPNSASIYFDFNEPVITNNAWIRLYDTVLSRTPVQAIRCDTSSIPLLKLNFKDSTVCRGNTIRIQASGGDKYSWQPSMNILDSAHSAQEVSANTNQIFKVTASRSNSCFTATDSLSLKPANPDTTITRNPNELIASLSNDSVLWLRCFDFSRIPSANTIKFTVTTPGSFAAQVWKDGCADTTSCTEFNSGFYELPYIYPNPAEGGFSIRAGSGEQDIRIEIYDMYGRRVKSETRHKLAQQDLNYRPGDMSPGVYILLLSNSAGTTKLNLLWQGGY